METLHDLRHLKDALSVRQVDVFLYRTLATDEDEGPKKDLAPLASSLSSLEVCVPQKDCSMPLSPSVTMSISITPLSSQSTTHPNSLAIVSPSPSICNGALVELHPNNLHYSSHVLSSSVPADQTAVIEVAWCQSMFLESLLGQRQRGRGTGKRD